MKAWLIGMGAASALALAGHAAQAGGCAAPCGGGFDASTVEYAPPRLHRWKTRGVLGRKLRYDGFEPYSYDPNAWRTHPAQVPCMLRQPVYDRYGIAVGYHRVASVC